MAICDPKAKIRLLDHAQFFALVLAEVAVLAAAEYLRDAGYKPTQQQFREINRRICVRAIACGTSVAEGVPGKTDDELLAAVEQSGRDVVRDVLGRPPAEALN